MSTNDRAACIDHDPEIWFETATVVQALSICGPCPIRQACLAEAIRQEGDEAIGIRFGVRGGTTPAERYYLATGRIAKRDPDSIARADAAFSGESARAAHAAYKAGRRTLAVIEGERCYQRNRKRRNRNGSEVA